MNLSVKLRSQIMSEWYDVESVAVAKVEKIQNIDGANLHVPFVSNNGVINTAVWNVALGYFDQLLVDVYVNDNERNVITLKIYL